MSRWLEIAFQVVVFAVPCSVALLMAWPLLMKRAVPTEWDADALTIGATCLVIGVAVTLMLGSQGRAVGRLRR